MFLVGTKGDQVEGLVEAANEPERGKLGFSTT